MLFIDIALIPATVETAVVMTAGIVTTSLTTDVDAENSSALDSASTDSAGPGSSASSSVSPSLPPPASNATPIASLIGSMDSIAKRNNTPTCTPKLIAQLGNAVK